MGWARLKRILEWAGQYRSLKIIEPWNGWVGRILKHYRTRGWTGEGVQRFHFQPPTILGFVKESQHLEPKSALLSHDTDVGFPSVTLMGFPSLTFVGFPFLTLGSLPDVSSPLQPLLGFLLQSAFPPSNICWYPFSEVGWVSLSDVYWVPLSEVGWIPFSNVGSYLRHRLGFSSISWFPVPLCASVSNVGSPF